MLKPRQSRNSSDNNYAFIDSQNLNLGTQKMGWKMDWRKFRHYLRSKYKVTNAYMFIGYMPEFEDLYQQLHDSGYLVVLKPTSDLSKPHQAQIEGLSVSQQDPPTNTEKPEQDPTARKSPIKGNIDADLVLWTMKEFKNYHKAIIVSGDGDFHSLAEYLKEQGKLQNIMTPNWQYSQLLKEFDSYIVRLDKLRNELAYRSRPRTDKADQ